MRFALPVLIALCALSPSALAQSGSLLPPPTVGPSYIPPSYMPPIAPLLPVMPAEGNHPPTLTPELARAPRSPAILEEDSETTTGDSHSPPRAAAMPSVVTQGRSLTEIYLSLGMLVFGMLLLALEIGVLLRLNQGWGADSTRIVGLTLVVIAGVFLITAGYSESQIAPMIGLLGTIVGYLLGKSDAAVR